MIGRKVPHIIGSSYDYSDYFYLYDNIMTEPHRVSVGTSINFFCTDERIFGRLYLKDITIEEFEAKLIHRDDLKDYVE